VKLFLDTSVLLAACGSASATLQRASSMRCGKKSARTMTPRFEIERLAISG